LQLCLPFRQASFGLHSFGQKQSRSN